MTNKRKILKQADAMTKQAKQAVPDLPDWAGLAWVIDPRWASCRAAAVAQAMGSEWMARAWRICKALAIAAEWNAERKYLERINAIYGVK